VQVLEATAGTVLAAAVIGTAGGMGWLLIQLPNRLQQLETQMTQILANQNAFSLRFQELEKKVTDLDRRTIRLELN
jgi:hypothetical protein